MSTCELYHHGVKGQKWGVRRYQYTDGSLTPEGKRRLQKSSSDDSFKSVPHMLNMKVSEVIGVAKRRLDGERYADSYLKKGTTLARIQTSPEFEKFAFYATYKKQDQDKYLGLFGKNLRSRAEYDARTAEKIANQSGTEEDKAKAKELSDRSANLKVYQLKLEATKKLKIPSDENARHITNQLLQGEEFKQQVGECIANAKNNMKRPQQQILLNSAQRSLRKDPADMSESDKQAIYKAFNLSLTYHDPVSVAAQATFYGELKKKGYNALPDYNDQQYSSYHAKRPTIVFDTDSVTLNSVAETSPKTVDKLYTKYNNERIRKETIASTIGLIQNYGIKTLSECENYLERKRKSYLELELNER